PLPPPQSRAVLRDPRSVGQKHDDCPTGAASETTMLDPPVLVRVSDCVSVVSIGMLPKLTVEGEVEGWPEVVGPPDEYSVVSRTSPYPVTLHGKVRRFTAFASLAAVLLLHGGGYGATAPRLLGPQSSSRDQALKAATSPFFC